jgi:hypothetical protein
MKAMFIVESIILFSLPSFSEQLSANLSETQANALAFEKRIFECVKSSKISYFTEESEQIIKEITINELDILMNKYKEYYQRRYENDEYSEEREKIAIARAIIYFAGRNKLSSLFEKYYPNTVNFWFLIAYADSKGVKLYYSITELFYFDCIIEVDQIRLIVSESRIFKEEIREISLKSQPDDRENK